MANIAVIGAGGWGTALAVMAHQYGNTVSLWSPFEEEVAAIRRHDEHKKLLPGVAVPPSIRLTTNIACAAGADLVIMAVPSFAIRSTAARLADVVKPATIIANAGKGLEDATLKRFTQVIAEAAPAARVVALSGPSHAEEVARGVPTTVVSASEDLAAAERVQELLMNPSFRIYVNRDVTGVELGGALKNVVALSCGICSGLGYQDNTKALLMTRAMAEMTRLGEQLGGTRRTFGGLAGMGDLIVTCTSMHSRNNRAGILIGQGKTVEEAMQEVGAVVEGYYAAESICQLARREDVEMPICTCAYEVLYKGRDARLVVSELMRRAKKDELLERTWL